MSFINLLSKEELSQYSHLKKYKYNDVIFNQGSLCESIGYIEKGEVSIITLTHTEKEETITYLKKGEVFGDILLFSNTNTYLGHAICKKEATIRYFYKEDMLKLLEKKEILTSFLEELSNKAMDIKKENKLLKHKNIEDRIMHYLLEESQKRKNQPIELSNITYLANVLAIPRESISRNISKLAKNGKIKIKKVGQKCYIELNHISYYS